MSLSTFIEAAAFAAEKHTKQRRKDLAQTPYIEHPIEVAQILSQCGISDSSCLAAALLHDTIEDTNTTLEEIQTKFGDKVLLFVREVSDDKSLSKDERKRQQVSHSSQISNEAKMIKMADKLSNFRSSIRAPPKGWDEARVKGYFTWGLAVVHQCRIAEGPFAESCAKLLAMFETFQNMVPEYGTPEADEALERYYQSMRDLSRSPTL
jgi:guanosine-3',5'-bis(diphosphate) 3'-pyrophosphohydrolase